MAEAATDLGRVYLDVVRFRKRYYDKWMDKLSYLSGEYRFDLEARRLVETALLADVSAGMPLTGRDIIDKLGVPPGPQVGAALVLAKRLFEEEPADGDRLLAKLRDELGLGHQVGAGSDVRFSDPAAPDD